MHAIADLMRAMGQEGEVVLYVQLQRALRIAIARQWRRPDTALPSERQLADELGLSRITVRKAIDGLVNEGVLIRRARAGNFVTGRAEMTLARLSSFSEEVRRSGKAPTSVLLDHGPGLASEEEALCLQRAVGSRVYRVERVRYADQVAVCVEQACIVDCNFGALELAPGSLYEALASRGRRPVTGVQRFAAQRMDAAYAVHLGAQAGEPALVVERRGYLADGGSVEWCRSYFRGDRFEFAAHLSL